MANIQIMSEELSNKIAAGEVVEKTMNVVKELVENSIDAKSTEITIELIDSGVKEIKVIDNGTGMDKDDAVNCFSRHATSKLLNLDDLFYIETLGFRGEALPSIASVSNVELRTSNGKTGTLVKLKGCNIEEVSSYQLVKGTTIIVKDLFYNTPVRLKYLNNLYVELANIIEYVNKMALSFPNIKFILRNNDKEILNTTGNGDLYNVIYNIYGGDITRKMTSIEGENDDYYISGYISYPEVTKSNRNHITTLVNGRIIKNNKLNKIIIDSYHTYIPKEKYPIIVLNIEVDPILIDVNIHPNKMDIKFSKMNTLEELVSKLIKEKLKTLFLIPSADVRNEESINEVKENNTFKIPDRPNFTNDEETKEEPKYEEVQLEFEVHEKEENYIKRMEPKGIVFSTYIIAENEDGMYIIDQHAAAERINYEKVLKSLKENVTRVDLLIPLQIELKKDEALLLKNNFDILKEYGFIVEEFGINTFIVRSYPSYITEDVAEESIRKVIDIIVTKGEFDLDLFIWRMAATMACRMSVKANDYLNYDDQVWLLETLRKCDNPYTCPHGRPTIIKYTKDDLEKMFKRIMN